MNLTRPLLALLTACFLTALPTLSAQQCHDYPCVIAKVERLLQAKQKNYQTILDNLDSAESYPDSKPEEVRALRRRVFVAIEQERKEAIKARDESKRQTKIAEAEKTKAQAAERKATAVLDKIYFYDGKFGLAYDKGSRKYGFIDKDLKTKIDFKYEEALPFDYTGFAKVKKRDVYYLVDTTGNEYKLATDMAQLDTSITALDLRNKDLTVISPSIFEQTQLKVLWLSENQLTILPAEIGKLTNLTSLDMSYTQMTILPVEIVKLTNLTSLHLSINELAILPAEIGKLTKLTYLDLSYNELTILPAEIGKLTNLANLYLSSNQLTILPAEIGKLSNLTDLFLSGNQLHILPAEIVKLTKLTDLHLSSNQLTILPAEIGKLTNLITLHVPFNQIPTEEQEKIKKLLPNCEINF